MNTLSVHTGIVEHGEKKGTALGFPTANIQQKEMPPGGIYAGVVTIGETTYQSALYVNTKRSILEAHLLDFSGDLYGMTITMTLFQKIRDDSAYSNEHDLRAQIYKDTEAVRAYFENAPK